MSELRDLVDWSQPLRVDTSEDQPVYLLITRKGRYLRLSPSAHTLLRGVYEGRSPPELAAALSALQGSPVSAADVESAYQHLLGRLIQIERLPDRLEAGFWVRIRCLPAGLVARVARPLSTAFRPWPAAGLLGLIGAAALLLPWSAPHQLADPSTFWWAYLLFLLSLVVHEFGHASACSRYGARPGDIGFTLYWIYPSFYCDVSAIWQLTRWQRAVVDAGGVFLQLVAAALYVLVYTWLRWEPARLAALMILASAVFALNPLLKFDGYWLLADLLGVTNLSQQPRRLARVLAARLRGLPAEPLPWPPVVILAVACYSIASVCFWIYVLRHMLPLLHHTTVTLPAVAGQAAEALRESGGASAALHIQQAGVSLFVLVISALMIWRLLSPVAALLYRAAHRLLRGRAGRPQTQSQRL